MSFRQHAQLHGHLAVALVRLGVLGGLVGVASGAASAIFLLSLAKVTAIREATPWLLYLLPVAGVVMGFIAHTIGKSAEAGTNVVLDEVIEFQGRVPKRMAPLVLFGTLVTHLFGGSAGREGTAVQMGASLSQSIGRVFKLKPETKRLILMAGISGGFGSVFGTPLAGAVFGMEVSSVGRIRYEALWPCLVASCVGDLVCRSLGVGHAHYAALGLPLDFLLVGKVLLASLAFALAAGTFSELAHFFAKWSKAKLSFPPLRLAVGGVIVVALVLILQTREYLGLGVNLIDRSFTGQPTFIYAFALKILFTTVTVGFGFKGGEVTPLFATGAVLGAAIAPWLGLDPRFLAAVGFIAVFAAASNTPIASIVMGVELFGVPFAIPLAIACGAAYVLVGHRSIYASQRYELSKLPGTALPPEPPGAPKPRQ